MSARLKSCPQCGGLYSARADFCGTDGAELDPEGTDALLGRTIDRYTITGIIGDGGMARVYRARHTFLDRECAVKVLFADLAADEVLKRRFNREAHAACRIDHPHVVDVFDFGETEAGLAFMAMELVEGASLADLIRTHGPLEVEWIRSVAMQLAGGLSAIHEHGFVHRDLKPANVMIVAGEEGPHAKILDFGIVHLRGPGSGKEGGTQLTKTGFVMGTPSYMAPEQITADNVSPQTDLYALGAILFELLSGKPPFDGDMKFVLTAHLAAPVPPLDRGGELADLARTLLAKAPSERPQGALEVQRLLSEARVEAPVPLAVPIADDTSLPHLSIELPQAMPEAALADPDLWKAPITPAEPPPSLADVRIEREALGGRSKFALATVALGVVAVAVATWLAQSPEPEVAAPQPQPAKISPATKTPRELITHVQPSPSPDPPPPSAPPPPPPAPAPVVRPDPTPPRSKPTTPPRPRPEPRPASKPEPEAEAPSAGEDLDEALARLDEPRAPAVPPPAEPAPPIVSAPPPPPVPQPDRGDLAKYLRELDDHDASPSVRAFDEASERAAGHLDSARKALRGGKLEGAEVLLKLCLDDSPDQAQCHKLLGLVEELSGRAQPALRHYGRYLSLAGDAPDRGAVERAISRVESSKIGGASN